MTIKRKYEEMKASYDAKSQQIHRLKVQNVGLLNMAAAAAGGGGKGDSDHIKRLEELLQVFFFCTICQEWYMANNTLFFRRKGKKQRL